MIREESYAVQFKSVTGRWKTVLAYAEAESMEVARTGMDKIKDIHLNTSLRIVDNLTGAPVIFVINSSDAKKRARNVKKSASSDRKRRKEEPK